MFVDDTSGEVEAEVNMSLQFLHQRIDRIKGDVHNVRAAELVLHRDRVARHAKGVEVALAAQVAEITAFKEVHAARSDDVANRMRTMTEGLVRLRHTRRLVAQQEAITALRVEYEQMLKHELQGFRQKLNSDLKNLLQANGAFRASFRTFTEQGNFSAEEIQE